MKKVKLLVVGHGRHGKDTVCDILKEHYGLTFESSSRFFSKHFIYDMLKDKYGYTSEEECFNDRHNHRAEWFDAISDYNVPDASKLGRAIFEKYDVYCGMRNRKEFFALQNVGAFDYSIWVDRSEHLPLEPITSMNVEQWMTNYTIDNNGTLEQLEFNTIQLMTNLLEVRS